MPHPNQPGAGSRPALDKPREECGLIAIRSRTAADVAGLAQLGLFALQHRGQESCGICVAGGREVRIEKDMGLISEVSLPPGPTSSVSLKPASPWDTRVTLLPVLICASTHSRLRCAPAKASSRWPITATSPTP